jgi:lipopolysaccharide transport system permease protein
MNFTNFISFQHRGMAIARYWQLLRALIERNLKLRYRGSFLGVYWSLVNPLISTGLYTAIFGTTFASYYGNSITNYILAAFTGLMVMTFFSASTSQALISVVHNGALLNKIHLPVSIFPVSMIGSNVFQLAIGTLPLLILITAFTSKSIVNVLGLFVPCFSLVGAAMGTSFLVSTLYVFFRDVSYLYELVIFVLGISTPIFYPAAIVPNQIKPFLQLNPLSPIIESIRQIALSGNPPDWALMQPAVLSGIICLAIGWTCFRSWRSHFMDLL